MADPRSNVASLRSLGGMSPPPRPPARPPVAEPDERPEAEDDQVSPSAAEAPTAAPRPVPDDAAATPPAAAQPTRPSRPRTQQRRSRRTAPAESAVGGSLRRDVPTTVYLPKATRERLRVARAQTRMSAVDVILDAIHTEWKAAKADEEIGGPAPARDPDLELPVARRPRRQVEDGAPVQIRLTRVEHDQLTRLASRSGVSLSELVTTCVDRRWDPQKSARDV